MSENLVKSENILLDSTGDLLNHYHDMPDIITDIKVEVNDCESSAIGYLPRQEYTSVGGNENGKLSLKSHLDGIKYKQEEIESHTKIEEVYIKTENKEDSTSSTIVPEKSVPNKRPYIITIHKTNTNDHISVNPSKSRASRKKIYSCQDCNYTTPFLTNLKRHSIRHKSAEQLELYKCDECLYRTADKSHLKRHILRHKDPNEVQWFKCPKCDYQSSEKSVVKKHLIRHQMNHDILIQCDKCSYRTFDKAVLRKHKLCHKDRSERDLKQCFDCGFETVDKGSLKRHVLRHRRPEECEIFKCSECDYQTVFKYYLKHHSLCHKASDEVIMYKCDDCSYQSAYKNRLRNHVFTHRKKRRRNAKSIGGKNGSQPNTMT